VLWVLGRLVRRLREREAQLRQATQELAERQAELAQVAVFTERARIARELHDVVAQSVNVMLVQAGGVRSVVERGGPVPRDALLAIEVTGRQALDELDRLLGILRRPEDGTPGLTPPPQLDALPELATAMSRAGLPTEVIVEGEVRALSEMLQLSAYRIVQEALTNARRHAPGSRVQVELNYLGDRLAVRVVDDGTSAPVTKIEDRTKVMGHGLVGMRERATMLGGRFAAGPRTEGGFAVQAELPVGQNRRP
jgi:signal transduction histidine kinase